MDLYGHPYTWERKDGEDSWTEVRLDRALASLSFVSYFKEAKLYNLEISTSDHSPILLEIHKVVYTTVTRKFKFENAWLREPLCKQIVEDSWQGVSLQQKIAHCANSLWQ